MIDAPPSATSAVRLGFPNGLDFACRFEAVESWIQRTFFEPKQTAPGVFQSLQNLEPMCLASLQRR
jgi:hypothetical protein